MRQRLIITCLFIGASFFAVFGCKTTDEVEESGELVKIEAAAKAPEARDITVKTGSQESTVNLMLNEDEIQKKVLRVNCGAYEPYTDKAGNLWLTDQDLGIGKEWGADGGEMADRGDLDISETNSPGIYETERYSMYGYHFNVPNGPYIIRLHFAETYSGIYGEGERVFSVSINEKNVLEDFDCFKEAGGLNKPVVKIIDSVMVTDGKLLIEFALGIQNPEINGIEIIPE